MGTMHRQENRIYDSRHAFTLVEVVISAGILAVFVTGSFATLIQLNRMAMVAKLRTAALVLAQQQIDSALAVPWQFNGAVPQILTTHDEPPDKNRYSLELPLNDDATVKKAGVATAYSDLDLPVGAWRHTEVTDFGPRTKMVTVTVTYDYRGKEYEVELSTIRACDNN